MNLKPLLKKLLVLAAVLLPLAIAAISHAESGCHRGECGPDNSTRTTDAGR